MGAKFFKISQFLPEELHEYPILNTTLENWRLESQNKSTLFASRMSKAIEALR